MSDKEKALDHNGTEEESNIQPISKSASPALNPTPEASRFTANEKWFIVCFTSFVGLFSPLTGNIYFPAIPTISHAFNKSTELINLTVTMYIVLQGIAPMLWGPVSDHVGRRPISAACLLILALSCVGLARVPTSDYWLLMLLRCLQATGSASTVAIGAGVVGDISTRAERGGFFGVFTLGPLIGPAVGPVIGGLLADHLGWRAIFWFLCIAASVCFFLIILFQPETLASVVDSKNYDKLLLVYKPVIPIIGHGRRPSGSSSTPARKVPKNPFRLFLNIDVDILLAISAIICAVFYGVIATISSLFVTAYPFLNETTLGLCFLAIGGGMALGSTVNGRILDFEYKRIRRRIEGTNSENDRSASDASREENFPLERARLSLMPYYAILTGVACAGNGWCIQKQVNIAGPLVLQFIVGYSSTALMNGVSTLMIDLVPGQSSSVTACNNLIRCSLSAVIVSIVEPLIKGIGIGWTYVFLGALSLLSLPLVYLSVRLGPGQRVKRQRAQELAEASST